ncbi:MAG: hypothetical protein JWP78_163 [Mucilaginibacter sp.]|nr:hypothetical protein [Mucilaginibacter sp.]
MALPYQKQSLRYLSKLPVLLVLLSGMICQSCKNEKRIYKSDCNDSKTFKRVSFKELVDNLEDYDQKYVEISGKYEEDKELSALFNDSLLVYHSNKNALWVDFSQECPLYLSGTRKGLFDYNDGKFTQLNNKYITIRGLIDVHNKGYLKQYKGTIERVSFVKL